MGGLVGSGIIRPSFPDGEDRWKWGHGCGMVGSRGPQRCPLLLALNLDPWVSVPLGRVGVNNDLGGVMGRFYSGVSLSKSGLRPYAGYRLGGRGSGLGYRPGGSAADDPVFQVALALAAFGGLVWTLIDPLFGGGFIAWLGSWAVSSMIILLGMALLMLGLALAILLAIPFTIWVAVAHTIWLWWVIPSVVVLLGGIGWLASKWDEAEDRYQD